MNIKKQIERLYASSVLAQVSLSGAWVANALNCQIYELLEDEEFEKTCARLLGKHCE